MRAPACPLRPGPVASAGPTGYSAAMCAKIARQRADQLVFMQGLAESREQARRLIMAGKVALSSEGLPPGAPPQKVDKPGHPYPEGTVFELLGQERFVSRGAYKLLTILDNFKLDVSGMVCLDAGASTGGFTDCLLQHGATRVYAVDVGKNQLHEKLRADERVINLEGVNLRAAAPELIPEPVDLVVADVSFISLTLILPPCMTGSSPAVWPPCSSSRSSNWAPARPSRASCATRPPASAPWTRSSASAPRTCTWRAGACCPPPSRAPRATRNIWPSSPGPDRSREGVFF